MKISNIKYKLNSWIVTAIVIIAVILLNVIVSALGEKISLKVDLTSAKQYELTQETKTLLKNLDTDVKISVLSTRDTTSNLTNEYLDNYKKLSEKISIEYIDVYKNQSVLNEYQAKGETLMAGDLLLTVGERYKIISSSSLISNSYSLSEDEDKYSFDLETKLTNGIVSVTGAVNDSAVYYLEGHNEYTGLTYMPGILKAQDYKTETINITNGEIPEDAVLIMTIAPTADFSADECNKIDAFLEKGGSFLVMMQPTTETEEKLPRLKAYLEEWGITARNDIVVETDSSKAYPNNPYMMQADIGEHEITDSIAQQKLPVWVYMSQDMTIAENNTQRAEVKALLTSSGKSFGRENILENQSITPSETDYKGPLNLAVIAEKPYSDKSKVMVLGSPTIFETETDGNKMLMENAFAYLTNNQSGLKISPKIITVGKITNLTTAHIKIMNILFVWVLPIIILAAGIVIWLRRRYL